jgi:hypothetical protein
MWAAAVALLSLVGLIVKHVLSDEATRKVEKASIDRAAAEETKKVESEIEVQPGLTEGLGNAWEAADAEGKE